MNWFEYGWELSSAIWCRKNEAFHVNLVGPAHLFTTTKSRKSGKIPKMHEKWPISPNWRFKYSLFHPKLYTIRRRIACTIFWASLHICNTHRSRVITEKPIEKSSTKFHRPNGLWKCPFPWPTRNLTKITYNNYCIKNTPIDADFREESNDLTYVFVSWVIRVILTKDVSNSGIVRV